ncbi:MAG: YebC/PmpR family DNA-binding transcriptional regulator [Candidatus Absconditabacteria bacterium]|nr:YebC/PmpR family DNA-binding transcriptional regulator [Candidatus Absconditabacteria bacterium]MDD3868236.1 YebC/PmpR family DNA-binding transcriptional regulator [Candidatus Absconditabacteria bacterium]MDD4714636.1 YebC/PmpR family DNA-binding transcriptional regulator [Candidatus Absconditabacteria bacterium]
MGRRHSIAARKASGDAAKSRTYSIIGKKIQIAAKNGADPKMNPSLEMILDKARYYGLPRDVIDRAILKGSGQLEGEEMKEITYEGYGPNGSAVLIKTITSNTNRTSSNIRTLLTKAGGAMAEIGSVAWQFQDKGFIVIDGKAIKYEDKGREMEKVEPFDAEELEMELLELPITDLSIEDGVAEVYTSKTDFIEVRKQVVGLGYHITESDLHYFADNMVTLSSEDLEIFQKIVDGLEEDDDVDAVYHNVEL